MAKKGTRRTTENALPIEKCSSPTCNDPVVIEIISWDGEHLDSHLLLCRKHWIQKVEKEPDNRTKVIHFIRDLRRYL